eukprot:CAMPEP_0113612944 /NCGR_PEP_ID=MMETSP0017_2-20120614/6379_1 /TAXON_ID=2856 /ORGANISM="Cylindrotheca closterium" /LENGTH=64 /DNA_ID=CAMNT_0000522031 /DNA_START=49 /DNA_END=240 /DNA_ORIENTATION=- /assembly_acc=CAM_ASM_000147
MTPPLLDSSTRARLVGRASSASIGTRCGPDCSLFSSQDVRFGTELGVSSLVLTFNPYTVRAASS